MRTVTAQPSDGRVHCRRENESWRGQIKFRSSISKRVASESREHNINIRVYIYILFVPQ